MKLRKLTAALLGAVLLLTGCSGNQEQTTTTAATTTVGQTSVSTSVNDGEEVEEIKGFQINNGKLIDENGNNFIMRGVNHAHTWFKDELETAIPAIAETGANTVRIVLSNGYQWTKDSASEVKEVVDLCKEHKLVVVLEVHDGTGKNEAEVLEGIVDYWIELRDVFIGNEAYVILNIANEWIGDWSSDLWATEYKNAIARIREAGIKNTIMVDAAGWGQYGQSIADKGAEVFASDPEANTMFSIHMYGSAGGSKAKIKKNIDDVINKGLCLVIGEFGYNHSDGDVKEDYIMEYCTETGTGYLGWSWKGNGGGVEYLDIAKEWDGSALSSDWGEILINGANGIKETSEICSIYE